jgi:hypothetical protein
MECVNLLIGLKKAVTKGKSAFSRILSCQPTIYLLLEVSIHQAHERLGRLPSESIRSYKSRETDFTSMLLQAKWSTPDTETISLNYLPDMVLWLQFLKQQMMFTRTDRIHLGITMLWI